MTLDEAIVQLRDLGMGAGLDSAAWLVRKLDEDDLRRLVTPARKCDCRRFSITPPQRRKELGGCGCFATALALRLTELAFGPHQTTAERQVTRHRHTCPVCAVPFVSRRSGAVYCPRCTGERVAA